MDRFKWGALHRAPTTVKFSINLKLKKKVYPAYWMYIPSSQSSLTYARLSLIQPKNFPFENAANSSPNYNSASDAIQEITDRFTTAFLSSLKESFPSEWLKQTKDEKIALRDNIQKIVKDILQQLGMRNFLIEFCKKDYLLKQEIIKLIVDNVMKDGCECLSIEAINLSKLKTQLLSLEDPKLEVSKRNTCG